MLVLVPYGTPSVLQLALSGTGTVLKIGGMCFVELGNEVAPTALHVVH